jgi:hypothetical protein
MVHGGSYTLHFWMMDYLSPAEIRNITIICPGCLEYSKR